jgi:predicted TIM-barrel fold metal-dependent hydrolase
MIVDAHCHAGRGDMMNAPWSTEAPIGSYLRRARAAGIHKTIVIPPGHSNYAEANAQLARIVAQHPDRLIGFAAVHATRDRGKVFQIVARAVGEYGFRGLKVHGYDALPTREICDAVRILKIPMLVDVVGRAHIIELLAPQYPDVNFIVPHIGSFLDDWRAQQQVVDQLVRFPNVYADTAGVRRFDYITQAIRRAGARKLIFGSDGPWLHPAVELHKIRVLKLPPQDESLILGGNVLRLIREIPTQMRSSSVPRTAPSVR